MQRKDIYSDKSVLEFLEIDGVIPESVVASPLMVGTHSETRAICAFSYFPQLKSLYLSVANRSTFIQKSGFFSFGKKKEAPETQGALLAYVHGKSEPNQIGDFNLTKKWWVNSTSSMTALEYVESQRLLLVGDESGVLKLIKVFDHSDERFEEIGSSKFHSAAIVDMKFNEDKKVVYTIGEDRRFKQISLEKKLVLNEFEVANKKPTCLRFSRESSLAYVSDSEGNIKIFDTNKNPPICVNSFKGGNKEAVTTFEISGNLIFAACGESGKVGVFLFADPKNSVSGC